MAIRAYSVLFYGYGTQALSGAKMKVALRPASILHNLSTKHIEKISRRMKF